MFNGTLYVGVILVLFGTGFASKGCSKNHFGALERKRKLNQSVYKTFSHAQTFNIQAICKTLDEHFSQQVWLQCHCLDFAHQLFTKDFVTAMSISIEHIFTINN